MKSVHDRKQSILDAMKLVRHPHGLLSLAALIGIAAAEVAHVPGTLKRIRGEMDVKPTPLVTRA
jgi:hypothetical protein